MISKFEFYDLEVSKTKYIYILSQRYSGSTLLSFLLGSHPEISTIGERRKFYTHSFLKSADQAQNCSCGQPFPKCEHWNAIKTGLLEQVDIEAYKSNPTEFKLFKNKYFHEIAYRVFKFCLINKLPITIWPFRRKLNRFIEFNRVLVQECLKQDSANAFLDSSKVIDHILFLSLIPEFDIHIVCLTRDPRAQVNSALKYNDWTIEEATKYWKREMINNKKVLDKINANYTVLNYEALCSDPKGEMIRLLDFLKLDSSGFSLDFRNKTQHIMGNYNMRLGKDTKITERKEWQSDLSKSQIKKIEDLTTDYQQYYSKSD